MGRGSLGCHDGVGRKLYVLVLKNCKDLADSLGRNLGVIGPNHHPNPNPNPNPNPKPNPKPKANRKRNPGSCLRDAGSSDAFFEGRSSACPLTFWAEIVWDVGISWGKDAVPWRYGIVNLGSQMKEAVALHGLL